MDMHATIKELQEVVCSVQSVPRLHNKDERKKSVSYELLESQQMQLLISHELGSRGISILRSCYLATPSADKLRRLSVCCSDFVVRVD
jgi:7-keto-8-aminopelargonate synthetase-like enzyme